jgi:truncated hemoglobin YjbI
VSAAAAAVPAPAANRPKYPDPDPQIWAALEGGPLLAKILKDFYSRVFADPRLEPFFEGVTQQRAQEKQYSFLFQVFTGKQVYFGESPRQAHHWMVIPDDLFDYREELFASCLRRHGLPERIVQKWRGIHELYRADIVKTEPQPKVVAGEALPLEGFGEITLSIGTLCDVCHQEIDSGETVRYHLRLGKVYCRECTGSS